VSKSIRPALILALVALLILATSLAAIGEPLKLGIFTDLHAHDANSPLDDFEMVGWETRLSACIGSMNAWPADLMIQLRDLVNGQFVLGADFIEAERIPGILQEVEDVYARFDGPRYYVLGNHDVESLTKEEFRAGIGVDELTYAFDEGGFHFVVLDAQFRLDGSDRGDDFWYMQGFIPPELAEWLREDLASSSVPTIVFVHQRLDAWRLEEPEIANQEEIRKILEADGDVAAVFQGHDHWGDYTEINGIHYVTFAALIGRISEDKPDTWAYVTLDAEARTIQINGVGEQADYLLEF